MFNNERTELLSVEMFWALDKSGQQSLASDNLIWEKAQLPLILDGVPNKGRVRYDGSRTGGMLSIVTDEPLSSFEAWVININHQYLFLSPEMMVGKSILAPNLESGFIRTDANPLTFVIPLLGTQEGRIFSDQVKPEGLAILGKYKFDNPQEIIEPLAILPRELRRIGSLG